MQMHHATLMTYIWLFLFLLLPASFAFVCMVCNLMELIEYYGYYIQNIYGTNECFIFLVGWTFLQDFLRGLF